MTPRPLTAPLRPHPGAALCPLHAYGTPDSIIPISPLWHPIQSRACCPISLPTHFWELAPPSHPSTALPSPQSISQLPRHHSDHGCDTVDVTPWMCHPSLPALGDTVGWHWGGLWPRCPSQGVPAAGRLRGWRQPAGPAAGSAQIESEQKLNCWGETRAGKCHGNCVSASRATAAAGAGGHGEVGTARWARWGGHGGVGTVGWAWQCQHRGSPDTQNRSCGSSEGPGGIGARASGPRQKGQSQVPGGHSGS